MKQITLLDNLSNKLILIFGGWGVDERLFSLLTCNGYDLALVYDYRDPSHFNPSIYSRYCNIRVIAWSMGVFEAAKTLYDTPLPITEMVAVNGTLHPIDEQFGIAETIYQGTLEGLNTTNLRKFRLRMCGCKSVYQSIESYLPRREIEDLRDELIAIQQHYHQANRVPASYHKAFVSREDLIFSTTNQLQAWQKEGVEVEKIEGGHWPDFQLIIDRYEQE